MKYKDLTEGVVFTFEPGETEAVYVRCEGGFRPARGGPNFGFCYPDAPVYVFELED